MKTIIAIASALLCVSGIGGAHAGDADATRCPQGKSLVTAPGTGTKKVDNDQVSYVVEIRGFEPQVVIKSSSGEYFEHRICLSSAQVQGAQRMGRKIQRLRLIFILTPVQIWRQRLCLSVTSPTCR